MPNSGIESLGSRTPKPAEQLGPTKTGNSRGLAGAEPNISPPMACKMKFVYMQIHILLRNYFYIFVHVKPKKIS